ncbi:M55 family metallopeptidase [Nonomuraea sp. NPDC050536]
MRVFISIDMEGVAGVAPLDQAVRGGTGQATALRRGITLMLNGLDA